MNKIYSRYAMWPTANHNRLSHGRLFGFGTTADNFVVVCVTSSSRADLHLNAVATCLSCELSRLDSCNTQGVGLAKDHICWTPLQVQGKHACLRSPADHAGSAVLT